MMIGVGIVGANPDRGWAIRAHIPALSASEDFDLVAVATTRRETAERARERFGARHAFTDAAGLAAHPDVDLVVVTVKVPAHLELVSAAIDAGKHVYCEWPLARTAAEAETLAAAAEAAGIHAAVGLQGRFAPAVATARSMIAEGRIGAVHSASVYSARTRGAAHEVPAWIAYTFDADSAAGLVEVLGGHALDVTEHVLGPIGDLHLRTALQTPEHTVAETGEPVTVTAADHLLGTAEVGDGALLSIHLHDGEAALPRTRIEIMGADGDLALVSAPDTDSAATQPQIGRLELYHARRGDGAWRPVAVAPDRFDALPVQARNVARLYHRLAEDLRTGTHTVPGFWAAQRLHTLLETQACVAAIERS
jgi:predicted dehydrogenase